MSALDSLTKSGNDDSFNNKNKLSNSGVCATVIYPIKRLIIICSAYLGLGSEKIQGLLALSGEEIIFV